MTDEATIDEAVRVALAAPYTRLLTREEDGGYSTSVLELPGCFSSGDTPEDAMEMLDEAIELWVAVEVEDGHDIPPPSRAVEYSGRLTLRLLPSIHERAALLAQHEGVSLNRYLANAISYYVGLGSPQPVPSPAESVSPSLAGVREEPGRWGRGSTEDLSRDL